MAERKQNFYLQSVATKSIRKRVVVADIFRPGKFICTITANLVLLGVTCWAANISVFIASNYCIYYMHYRYLNLLVTPLSIIVVTILYILFYMGYPAKKPSLWVKIDIFSKLFLTTLTLISNILAMSTCKVISNVHKSPGPIGILGCVCLFLSCCTLFTLYRYKEMEEHLDHNRRVSRKISRDSHILEQQRRASLENIHWQVGLAHPPRKSSIISNSSLEHTHTPRKMSRKSVTFKEPWRSDSDSSDRSEKFRKERKCVHCALALKPCIYI